MLSLWRMDKWCDRKTAVATYSTCAKHSKSCQYYNHILKMEDPPFPHSHNRHGMPTLYRVIAQQMQWCMSPSSCLCVTKWHSQEQLGRQHIRLCSFWGGNSRTLGSRESSHPSYQYLEEESMVLKHRSNIQIFIDPHDFMQDHPKNTFQSYGPSVSTE